MSTRRNVGGSRKDAIPERGVHAASALPAPKSIDSSTHVGTPEPPEDRAPADGNISDTEVDQRELELASGQVAAISHDEFIHRVRQERRR